MKYIYLLLFVIFLFLVGCNNASEDISPIKDKNTLTEDFVSADNIILNKNSDIDIIDIYNLLDYINDDGETYDFNTPVKNYKLLREGTKVFINNEIITIKTVLWNEFSNIKRNADYIFSAHTQNGKFNYNLESVDIYEFEKNENTAVIFSIGEVDFKEQWITIDRNGALEYYISEEQEDEYYFMWEVVSSEYPGRIELAGIRDNVAYMSVIYKGIGDTYIYDIANKSGNWMSGADDFETYYKSEIAQMNELLSEEYREIFAYRNYRTLSFSKQSNFALIFRTKIFGDWIGEYYIQDLATGQDTYICNSYYSSVLKSMDFETHEWLDDSHLRINAIIGVVDTDFIDGKEYSEKYDYASDATYDVMYNGSDWIVTEVSNE